MKRTISLLLIAAILIPLAACGAGGVDTGKLVVWHDKEDAVIEALTAYLAENVPEVEVVFEKKTSLTDSLKLVGNDPSSAPDMFIFAHDKIGVFAEMGILADVNTLLGEGALDNWLPMRATRARSTSCRSTLRRCYSCTTSATCRTTRCPPLLRSSTAIWSRTRAGAATASWSSTRRPITPRPGYTASAAAWIHGFGGSIVSEDGTPFPEPEAVKEALRYHLKFVGLMPGETEYSTVNTLFLEGKADSTIGGPWMVPSARDAGIELGIARAWPSRPTRAYRACRCSRTRPKTRPRP